MMETLARVDEIEPLATKSDGTRVVNFEDATYINTASVFEDTPDTGDIAMNADGTIAKSKRNVLAINEEAMYANRFRTVKTSGVGSNLMQVVTDYRAITEQSTGNIYKKNIPAYEFKREGKEGDKSGALRLVRIVMVSDSEFVSEFTHKLSGKSMAEILPLINMGGSDMTTEEITI